jgi:hypothetical protein
MTRMNDLIRQAAGITSAARCIKPQDVNDDSLGGDITPDADQGRRNSAVSPSISMEINDRIRRAVGISVRPGQRSVPEIGEY